MSHERWEYKVIDDTPQIAGRPGEKVEETQWHNLVFFGNTVDIVEKYVEKGKEIAVEGKIVYRSWDDKEGIKHYITEIRVEELVLLGGK